jgi:hypothetical protein
MNNLRQSGLGFEADSPEHLIRFSIDNVRQLGRYIGGWVLVESIEGDEPLFLAQGTYCVDDPVDENKLVKELFTFSPETRDMGQYVWKDLVHSFFGAVVNRQREGEAFTKIGRLDGTDSVPDIIEDVVGAGDPTILCGQGSATKGVLATGMCVHLSLGKNFAGLATAQAVPMYLDWEDSATRLNQRVQLISRGLGLKDKREYPEIMYRRCSKPLVQLVNQVCRERDKAKADFLVIDSLDPASGYEGAWNERAGRLFDALRVIDMTTLIIAHTNKASIFGKGDAKQDVSVYGSIMSTNRARSVWRVVKEQEPEASTALVTLHHDKVNGGKIKKPIQLDISWRFPGEIRIDRHWPVGALKQMGL